MRALYSNDVQYLSMLVQQSFQNSPSPVTSRRKCELTSQRDVCLGEKLKRKCVDFWLGFFGIIKLHFDSNYYNQSSKPNL